MEENKKDPQRAHFEGISFFHILRTTTTRNVSTPKTKDASKAIHTNDAWENIGLRRHKETKDKSTETSNRSQHFLRTMAKGRNLIAEAQSRKPRVKAKEALPEG